MRVFLNYRRDDSAAHSGRLYDRLVHKFGKSNIFMDIDAIMPGEDFERVIEDEIAGCDCLLVMIGDGWLHAKDDHGNRRLENPRDFVLLEIAAALNRGVTVIPVLLDGTVMPPSEQIPDVLQGLLRRQAVSISHASFHHDVDRLIASIERIRQKQSTAGPSIGKHLPKILLACAAIVALVYLVTAERSAPVEEPPPPVTQSTPDPVQPERQPEPQPVIAEAPLPSTRVNAGVVFRFGTLGEYMTAVEQKPRDADLRSDFADALTQAGFHKEALEQLRAAVSLPPNVIGRGFLFRDLAKSLDRMGDLDGAIDAARKSLTNWPSNKEPNCVGASETQLGKLLEKAGDYNGAIAMWQDVKRRQIAWRKSTEFADSCQEQINRIQKAHP